MGDILRHTRRCCGIMVTALLLSGLTAGLFSPFAAAAGAGVAAPAAAATRGTAAAATRAASGPASRGAVATAPAAGGSRSTSPAAAPGAAGSTAGAAGRSAAPTSTHAAPATSTHAAPATSTHAAPAPATSTHAAPAPATSTHAAPAPATSTHAAPATSTHAAPAPAFTDLTGVWDAAQIVDLARLGILSGEAGGRFDPEASLTRAQLAALLQRTLLKDPGGPPRPTTWPFSDVRPTGWEAPAVAAVRTAGWMQGVGQDMFMPGLPVTRAQAVAAVARALRLPPGPATTFRDRASIPPWATSAVDAAVAAHLIAGYPGGTFRPNAPLNRAAAAHLFLLVYRWAHRPPPPPPPAPPPPPVPPAAPGGLVLTSFHDHVDVVWKAVYGAHSYTVQRRGADGAWQAVGSTSDVVWGDYHATPDTPYAYRVVAVGATGLHSPPSDAVAEPALTAAQRSWAAATGFSVATAVGLRDAATWGPGSAFGLGGLNLKALPRLPSATSLDPGTELVLDDNPETVRRASVTYQGPVAGEVRVYFDHINGTGGPARFALLLINPGPSPLPYAVLSRAETTGGGPKRQGRVIAADLLGSARPGPSGTLPAGQVAILDPGGPTLAAGGGSILGFSTLRLGRPGRLVAVLVPANQDPAALFRAGRLAVAAGADGAGRGTFPGDAVRTVTLSPSPDRPEVTVLADGHQDPYVTGTNAVTGEPAVDTGNFGVVYRIVGTPTVPTAVVGVPVGGGYWGAVETGGRVYAAPSWPLSGLGDSGFLMALWQPGQRGEVDWTPPGGSYLPLDVITIPLG